MTPLRVSLRVTSRTSFYALFTEHPLSVVVVSRHRRFATIGGAVFHDLVKIVKRTQHTQHLKRFSNAAARGRNTHQG